MGREQVKISNPPPEESQLPSAIVKQLGISLNDKSVLSIEELAAIAKYRRAADYIAAAMIFLKDNVLLESDLSAEHIKFRLLGHWGTCPGLNMVYAHTNVLIKRHGLDMLYVVGPGNSNIAHYLFNYQKVMVRQLFWPVFGWNLVLNDFILSTREMQAD